MGFYVLRQAQGISWELGVGSRKLEVGSWELGVGSRKLEVGSWELGVGSGKLGVDPSRAQDDMVRGEYRF